MCGNDRTNRKCINGYSMSTCKCLIEKQKYIRMKELVNGLFSRRESISIENIKSLRIFPDRESMINYIISKAYKNHEYDSINSYVLSTLKINQFFAQATAAQVEVHNINSFCKTAQTEAKQV